MKFIVFLAFLTTHFSPFTGSAQSVTLQATGQGNTYSLINSALTDDGNAVEVPDCGHEDFGPHITQAFDRVLNRPVFRFHIHRDQDDDRCRKSDRQRTEIKVYAKSPETLKARSGNSFTYRWKFRLAPDFQPSRRFTHLHQIKAVGGSEDRMPLITLTARKGRDRSPDRFELRYAERHKQQTLTQVQLGDFLGQWVEVTERIAFGENDHYRIRITSLSTGRILMSYRNDAIRMWKDGADFIRPKWGIYRSLKDRRNLKDEIVDFADFSIEY